jgi:hypothetical protein
LARAILPGNFWAGAASPSSALDEPMREYTLTPLDTFNELARGNFRRRMAGIVVGQNDARAHSRRAMSRKMEKKRF